VVRKLDDVDANLIRFDTQFYCSMVIDDPRRLESEFEPGIVDAFDRSMTRLVRSRVLAALYANCSFKPLVGHIDGYYAKGHTAAIRVNTGAKLWPLDTMLSIDGHIFGIIAGHRKDNASEWCLDRPLPGNLRTGMKVFGISIDHEIEIARGGVKLIVPPMEDIRSPDLAKVDGMWGRWRIEHDKVFDRNIHTFDMLMGLRVNRHRCRSFSNQFTLA
jgi:hypothetical protein